MHHANQLNHLGDMFNQCSLYSTFQNGTSLHAHQQPGLGQTHLHGQQLHAGVQHHSPIEGYVFQNPARNALGGSHTGTGYGFASAFPSSLAGVGTFGNGVGLNTGLNNPYFPTFPYGI